MDGSDGRRAHTQAAAENVGKADRDYLSDSAKIAAEAGQRIQRSTELNYGTEQFIDRGPLAEYYGAPASGAGGESFVFRNAPIDAVVHEILGETYGAGYSIAPDVQGTITLRLDGVASLDDAAAGLGAALSLQGVELTTSGGSFLIARKGRRDGGSEMTMPVFVTTSEVTPPDASVAVLQVKYANVNRIAEIARPLVPDGLLREVDDELGFIVLSGDAAAVSSAIRIFKSLDVNWLEAISTALIPVENATPDEIKADLEPILSRLGGVSVIPMSRLESLLVISRRQQALEQVRQWATKLDQSAQPQLSSDTLVYEARYIDANRLVEIVSGAGQAAPISPPPLAGPQDPFLPPQASGGGIAGPGLYDQLSITVFSGRNAIIARGPEDDLQSLLSLIETIDQPQRQVLIEATIVEVLLTETDQIGVQWDAVAGELRAAFSDIGSGAVTSLFPGASLSFAGADVAAVINVLSTFNDVEIVSSPRVLVLNNETARLQIGDQVPVITQSAVSISDPGAPLVNSTSYRDTGVILTVTPSIRAGGMVEIEISQEVSGVAETTTSNIDSPTITQRSVESRLAVPDGAVAILGGLMSQTVSLSETGVPILKKAPLIGAAFRSRATNQRRTELVVLVEPTVVATDEPETDFPVHLRAALESAREGW
ncbi:MAG: secretin N-terminal domain-containing protein [Pseudomonadota bacterium]